MNRLVEDFDPSINVEGGCIDINDEAVVDSMNRYLSAVTAKGVITPYVALEKIRKILAYYKIFLPHTAFLEGDEGYETFELSQFGEKYGMTNTGEVKTKVTDGKYLYFEWVMNDIGLFDIYTEVVDSDELEELIAEFGDDAEEDEEETSSGAESTHDTYKASNMQEEKQLDDVPLNEISHKLAKKAEHKAAKKYYDAYDDETKAREKVQKEKTPEARKGAEDAKAVRTKAAKRVMKFQQYADKKKKLEKEENINELSRATAEKAYASARDKGRKADEISMIMTHPKNANLKAKWRKISNKKWGQARKFADYSDKKK